VGPGLSEGWRRQADSVPNGRSLHIDAGKPEKAQEYNRFDAVFAGLAARFSFCNFAFDTPMGRPYKRGSHGERGVPKTSRVIAAQGFMTLTVLPSPKVSAPRVVRSMHCLFGKGYAGGGGRLRFRRECFRRR